MTTSDLKQIWWPLRITYGVVALAAGADKYFNLLTAWEKYVSPSVAGLIPGGAVTLMHVVGVIEIAVGILILTRWTRLGAYVVSAWLLAIACNLLLAGYFDIAVRDIAMSVGGWTLARMTELAVPVSHAVPDAPSPARA